VGHEQACRIAARLDTLGIPLEFPILAVPVYCARDTAGSGWGGRLSSTPVPPGRNRVLVGHRTLTIMIAGDPVAGGAFPEGAALVVDPNGSAGFAVLGFVEFARIEGAGWHGC